MALFENDLMGTALPRFQAPQDTGEAPELGLPSYLVAADIHSVANNNQTFLESAAETVSNIPKFIGASILSGANQFYNIVPTLGNYMGGDFELSKTADVMESFDTDLGLYYQEHKESVDVAGFMLSSLVPGTGGIKLLNAGQKALEVSIATGKYGKTMSNALGLLTPNRQKHLNKALEEITNSNSLSLITNKNTVKAMAAGYGQAVYEMAAFETATAIALSDSPVLENQDLGDIATNIAVFGLAFGTIGGIYNITKTAFAVKKNVRMAAPENAPWTQIQTLAEGSKPSDKISYYMQQLDDMKLIPLVVEPKRRAFLESEVKTKVRTLNNMIVEETRALTGGDEVLATQAYAAAVGKTFDQALPEYSQATKYSRISELTKEEKLIAKANSSKASIADAEAAAEINIRNSYATLWGEGTGNTSAALSKHTTLSDFLPKNKEMKITDKVVIAGKNRFEFDLKGTRSTPVKEIGVKGFVSKPAVGTTFDIRSAGNLTGQARNIWALNLKPFNPKGAEFRPVVVGEFDTPLLDKLYREFDPRNKVKLADGTERSFTDAREYLDWLKIQKDSLANEMLYTKAGNTRVTKLQETIAAKLNLRSSYLSGVKKDNLVDDLFALESYSKEYTDALIAKGLHKKEQGIIPVYKMPRTLKATYDTSVVKDLDGNVLEGMAIISQIQRQEAQRVDSVFASYMGEDTVEYTSIGLKDLVGADRYGAGATLFGAASSNYGSLAMITEWLGSATSRTIAKKQKAFKELADPVLYKLANNQKAALEWEVKNNTLRSMEQRYVLHESGDFLEPFEIARYNKAKAAGKDVKAPILKDPESPLKIPLDNDETKAMFKMHVNTNGARRERIVELRASQGLENELEASVVYPVPPSLSDYPYFAIVRDTTITGTGHSKNIYAATAEDLAEQVGKLRDEPGLEILYKTEAERYYKATGQFDQTRALNENYLNSLFKRKGLDAPYLVNTSPQKIAERYLNWGVQQETSLVREFVSAKYERQFEYLRLRGEAFTSLDTSQFNRLASVKHAESVVKNPFMNYVKTALGVKNYADYPFWIGANKSLDTAVSTMYGKLTKVAENAKSVDELDELNTILREYGYKGAAYDMEMDLLANHKAPKGVLQNVVQKMNGLLATITLRLDMFNAATNAISANILYGAEMSSVIRAIKGSNSAAVGELAALSELKVPGTDKWILSAPKMLANSIKAFSKDSPELKYFKDHGFATSISEQYKNTLDNLSITGGESLKELNTKLGKALDLANKVGDKGERWTGNRLAEEFNRFNAAHTMKQVTDIAVKYGLMDEGRQLAYINTFVNRTQGNYLAAQRPMLFQGAIGQSIGLFQTYQFNLMQQLLRYMGEGTAKDTATLMGLQGTIFGMNGLPAFNAINTHIVGTASGNQNHKDFYTTVYGAAGKDAGDWLMYGVSSNFLMLPDLKTNLYTRGDINPRHLTIVPTDPANIPIIQAYGKFFGNIFNTASTIANGGDISTALLQGLEHNSLSRPLAGIAATLKGLDSPSGLSYTTSKRGNVIAANDFFSLVNMARMAGGKPLGEAVAVDAAYRFKTYALSDNAKRQKLGNAIKSSIIGGGQITRDQIEEFVYDYTKLGGQRQEFNQWVGQLYKTANTSQANKLRENLSSPFSQNMQLIMGGYELRDFK